VRPTWSTGVAATESSAWSSAAGLGHSTGSNARRALPASPARMSPTQQAPGAGTSPPCPR
jgi:hypothetical protein